jgi:sarcosine dehydrogenase
VEAYDLSPEDAKQVHPLMNVSDLVSALHLPGDGHIDPTALVRAYATVAKQRGAQICENTAVTGIETEHGRVVGIHTNAGYVKTSRVINCGGVWARKIADMAGVLCPMLAYKHAYIVTEEIPGLEGLPSIRDYNRSVYMKTSGRSLHIGGYEPNPVRLVTEDGAWDVEDGFAFGLYDLDYDSFAVHLDAHMNRVPAVEQAGIQSTVCGPESFTADHRPLMGESPELAGFYFGCGLNSAGIMYSGGFGRSLASWVATGKAEEDVYGFDVRRFHPECVRSEYWLAERSHETYANQSVIPWSHDQPIGGRGVRPSPFQAQLEAAGCAFVESHGMERPGWFETTSGSLLSIPKYDYLGAYSDDDDNDDDEDDQACSSNHKRSSSPPPPPPADSSPYAMAIKGLCNYGIHREWEAEHAACREAVVVFDTSAFGKLVVSGTHAAAAMEWLCSAHVAKPAGHTTYTTLCNASGGVEADLTVSVLEDGASFYLCTGGQTATRDLSWVTRVITDAGFDATVADRSDDLGILSIQGPRSRALLQELTADTSAAEEWGNDAFPFATHREVVVAGHVVRAVRVTFMGELGWELHISRGGHDGDRDRACREVFAALHAAGARHGLRDAGYMATASLSLEKGYRHWHGDLRCTDSPMAAGLGFTCKFNTATPFLGRAALEEKKAASNKGLNGRVACFTAGHVADGEAPLPLHGMEPLYRDGRFAGFLRSAGFGFTVGASVGYGWIHAPDATEAAGFADGEDMVTLDFLRSGAWEVETFEHGRRPARFHTKAPLDPSGKRIRGEYDLG